MFLTFVLGGIFVFLTIVLMSAFVYCSSSYGGDTPEGEGKTAAIFYFVVFTLWVLLGVHIFDGGIVNICK